MQEAVSWARAKTSLSTVLFMSDRASQEFSNVTHIMFLTLLPTLFRGLDFLWAFNTPRHGEGVCDGVGAGIKPMIYTFMNKQPRIPTVGEVINFLRGHTKDWPIRGKHAKFKE